MDISDISPLVRDATKNLITEQIDADLSSSSSRKGFTLTLNVKRTRSLHEPSARGKAKGHSLTITIDRENAVHIATHRTAFNESTRIISDIDTDDEPSTLDELSSLISDWCDAIITQENAATASIAAAPPKIVTARTPRATPDVTPRSSDAPRNDASSATHDDDEPEVSPYPSAPALNKWLKISPTDPRMTWDIWPRVRYKSLDAAHRPPSNDPVVVPVLTLRMRNIHGAMHRSACVTSFSTDDEE